MGDDRKIYIPLNKRRPEEQPRERLARHGVKHLRTSELIALILRTGTSGKSAVELSDQLMQKYKDDLSRIGELELNEIKSNEGFGTASGCALLAAFELGRRVSFASAQKRPLNLKRVSDVAVLFRKEFGTKPPEKFAAFYINRNYKLLDFKLISTGGDSATVVDPRDVFKDAILQNASAVILAHNHPGGSLEPSKLDLELSRQLSEAGHLFRIPVAEHVIVTTDGETGIMDMI